MIIHYTTIEKEYGCGVYWWTPGCLCVPSTSVLQALPFLSLSFPPSEFLSRHSMSLHCCLSSPPPNSFVFKHISPPILPLYVSLPIPRKLSLTLPPHPKEYPSFFLQCQISWKSSLYLLTSCATLPTATGICLLPNRRLPMTLRWPCPVAST